MLKRLQRQSLRKRFGRPWRPWRVGCFRWTRAAPVLHYDDNGWGVVESKIPLALFGLWGAGGDVLMVGVGPTVLRLRR